MYSTVYMYSESAPMNQAYRSLQFIMHWPYPGNSRAIQGQRIFNPLQPSGNQGFALMCDTLCDTWKTKGIIWATKEGPRGEEPKSILRITTSDFLGKTSELRALQSSSLYA